MDKLVVISGSLKSLDYKDISTSSQKFELSFAESMSIYFDVVIVSAGCSIPQRRDNMLCTSAKRLTKHFCNYLTECKRQNPRYVVMFGYNPFVLEQLLCLNCKVYPFIFDTHYGMIEFRRFLRRNLIDSYYKLGIWMLHRVSGVLLFKREASSELKLSVPYLITTVTSAGIVNEYSDVSWDNEISVLYAGAITNYNHLKEICEASEYIPKEMKVTFHIYGTGPNYNELKTLYKDSTSVRLYGRLPNSEIMIAMKKANIVLNIRNKNDIVNRFAYPSKLIEYMEQKKTILSTNINEEEPLHEVVYLIDDISGKSIAKAIVDILDDNQGRAEKISRMEDYLLKWHNRKKESEKIAAFIKSSDYI
jgi:glycosyltransferase involved in cell wall biosynthesis